jgi:hypothetical protein
LKTVVVTVASQLVRGFGMFMASCINNGINPVVLGAGSPFRVNSDKIHFLHFFLDQTDATHILFADCWDVMIASNLKEFEEKYLALDSPIVFAAEKNCWPDESLAPKFPPSPTQYQFLNSGLWMGEKMAVRMLIQEVLRNERNPLFASDQRIFSSAFLRGKSGIALDYKCTMFQNVLGSMGELSFTENRIKNVKTGELPCAFHGNGRADMTDIGLHLGFSKELMLQYEKESKLS